MLCTIVAYKKGEAIKMLLEKKNLNKWYIIKEF